MHKGLSHKFDKSQNTCSLSIFCTHMKFDDASISLHREYMVQIQSYVHKSIEIVSRSDMLVESIVG